MTRRDHASLPASRTPHCSRSLRFCWTVFVVAVGFGLHPLPIAAQTDLGRLRVSPFLLLAPAQPLIGWVQSEDPESSAFVKGVLIGAGIGAGVALLALEIFRFCDPADNSPTYTCTIDKNRGKGLLRGALAGAGIGAAIGYVIGEVTGSRGSSQEWSPVPAARRFPGRRLGAVPLYSDGRPGSFRRRA